ncbi:antibiotic biosynthesis monooxygenase family protein [Metabacillus fastidiosus]|uniref:Antibiotic biosynthesis monooxygenase n=1 Tax=Metabacillus fastidiosus TaxID=1458 RepID=A0ABU6P3A2_9BACI|nr:antibiotic biosynthesis monooxygenase [Metabacillus fastidiosus]MED4403398.1 antibiotic biosynthesis monooxygenase [Metabacillus fastidiosus]MED4453994.1 antibiotic biosynthesis monooxygenase [Metabacillus fastidiosus]MED4460752.1 antibiotic biosynthesis monooxygenase [Metabacillus fastidiosus]
MFIQLKTITVTEGNAEKMVERFAGEGIIEEQPGFIDLSVLKKKQRKGNEEVVVMLRWESEDDWKAWETSEVHLAGHRANRGKPSPSFIIDSKQEVYHMLGQKEYRSEK